MGNPPEFQFEIGFSSHQGMKKEVNEDNYCAEWREDEEGHPMALLAVSNGVGGFSLGEIASKIAINQMEKFFKLGEFKQMYEEAEILEPHRVIQELYTRINHVILSLVEKENRQVGATLVSGFFWGSSVHIANVGNSRAFLLRKNAIKRLTEEKSDALAGVELGKLTSSESLDSRGKGAFVNSLGSDISLRADIKRMTVQEGDIFLFCSDGLYTQVDEPDILNIASQCNTMQAFCNALVDKANEMGGEDNITVTAIRITKQKRSLRSLISSGRKEGFSSILGHPLFIIILLVGVLLLLGSLLFVKKWMGGGEKPKPVPSQGPGQGQAGIPRGIYNSMTIETDVPFKLLEVDKETRNLDGPVKTFDFAGPDHEVVLQPDPKGLPKKLYTIQIEGLNRNLRILQKDKNMVILDYDTVTVHLTTGSSVDFIAKEEYTGSKFILKINYLASPYTIRMKAEENIQAIIKPQTEGGIVLPPPSPDDNGTHQPGENPQPGAKNQPGGGFPIDPEPPQSSGSM